MATLVTGATGYIGRRVALRLVRQGQRIRVLCRDAGWLDPEIKNSPLVEVMLGDLGDAGVVRRACADMSGIIHLAAGTGGPEILDRSCKIDAHRQSPAGIAVFTFSNIADSRIYE